MREQLVELARAQRRLLGWTQRDLALAMGTSAARVCGMESGRCSADFVLRALDAMGAPLVPATIDEDRDPMRDPALDASQLQMLSARMLRHARARRLAAANPELDAGDVAHALFNLTLSPAERLRSMFQRDRLRIIPR